MTDIRAFLNGKRVATLVSLTNGRFLQVFPVRMEFETQDAWKALWKGADVTFGEKTAAANPHAAAPFPARRIQAFVGMTRVARLVQMKNGKFYQVYPPKIFATLEMWKAACTAERPYVSFVEDIVEDKTPPTAAAAAAPLPTRTLRAFVRDTRVATLVPLKNGRFYQVYPEKKEFETQEAWKAAWPHATAFREELASAPRTPPVTREATPPLEYAPPCAVHALRPNESWGRCE